MSRHLKSYAVPRSWTLLKKVNKWTTRPLPGAHPFATSMPIALLLKQLGFARNAKEVKQILNEKNVTVDGKTITLPHAQIGFMDVIKIKPDVSLRCLLDEKGRLVFKTTNEITKKICKIRGKSPVKGGKVQLNLSDGRNVLVNKNESKTGDSVVIEIPDQKITETLPLEKGCTVFLVSGRNKGTIAQVESITGEKVQCKGKNVFETLKKSVFVIGKNEPAVKI